MISAWLTSWTLAAMVSFSEREATPSMHRLAEVIADVSIEWPLMGNAERTAAMLASIATSESGGFREDVLDCRVAGDSGRSLGAFQIWGAPRQVCTDWRLGARMALEIAADSLRTCRDLTAYCSGHCGRARGIAQRYMSRATRFTRDAPMLAPVD